MVDYNLSIKNYLFFIFTMLQSVFLNSHNLFSTINLLYSKANKILSLYISVVLREQEYLIVYIPVVEN